MLLGKINPVIKLARQVNNFTYTEITGSYIGAFAQRYVLGDEKARFEVVFGNIEQDENGNSRLKILTRNSFELSGQDIQDWGTDDSVILEKLAVLSGTTVTETVTTDFKVDRFL